MRPIDTTDKTVYALQPDTPVASSCVPRHLSPYVKELCLFLLALRQRLDRPRQPRAEHTQPAAAAAAASKMTTTAAAAATGTATAPVERRQAADAVVAIKKEGAANTMGVAMARL